MTKNYNEKRKAPRKKIYLQVFCWETDGERKLGKALELITRDVSADGLAFISRENIPIGTLMWVEIYLPNEKAPIVCKFNIVSVKSQLRKNEFILGAAFKDMRPEDRVRLASLIDQLDLYLLLDSALAGGASDLHLTVGRPPMARRDGKILTMAAEVIKPGQVEAMLYPLLHESQIDEFRREKELDFAFSPNPVARFRVNMHWQKGFVEATLRSIPSVIKNFSELGLPVEHMEKLCQQDSGLILIAGTTGSGKTTTMTAMIDYINQSYPKVIITLEDPIEYIIPSSTGIVKQRELGTDTKSFAEGLKRSLRQDPDVICVGELMGPDAVMAAMQAAETGRLVITTIHAPDAVTAIERVINFFDVEHTVSICQQLSSVLYAVFYQELLVGATGKRVVASELLINNSAISNLIKDNRYKQIGAVVQTGKMHGMYTLQSSIKELVRRGLIEESLASKYLKDNP